MKNDLCNKCGKCCSEIAVDFDAGVMFRDGIQILDDRFKAMLVPKTKRGNVTLCACEYLKNNLCTNPVKPDACLNYPSSPFAFLPENCGYEGEIFIRNEHIKQKIRRLKEEILDYEIRSVKEPELRRIIKRHEAFIDKYKVYGSSDW